MTGYLFRDRGPGFNEQVATEGRDFSDKVAAQAAVESLLSGADLDALITVDDVKRAVDVVYLDGAQSVLALALTNGRTRTRREARRVHKAAETAGWLAQQIRRGRR